MWLTGCFLVTIFGGLWGFQILNGADFIGDITNLILAIKIVYY